MIYLFIALIVALLINGLEIYLHYKEKEDVFDRYMAKSMGEYEYYKKEYPGDVKNKEDKIKADIETKKRMSPEDRTIDRISEEF